MRSSAGQVRLQHRVVLFINWNASSIKIAVDRCVLFPSSSLTHPYWTLKFVRLLFQQVFRRHRKQRLITRPDGGHVGPFELVLQRETCGDRPRSEKKKINQSNFRTILHLPLPPEVPSLSPQIQSKLPSSLSLLSRVHVSISPLLLDAQRIQSKRQESDRKTHKTKIHNSTVKTSLLLRYKNALAVKECAACFR